jgi:hypothetical protein
MDKKNTPFLRTSFKNYCCDCDNNFQLFETIYYLPLVNDSVCAACKVIIDSRFIWEHSIYVGSESLVTSANLKELARRFNESLV